MDERDDARTAKDTPAPHAPDAPGPRVERPGT
jgi:hypothetical protein